MKELIICRHGETEWNAERRIQGRMDIALSARGRDQAQRLSVLLSSIHPKAQAVVSSPMRRARETAEPIAQALGLPLIEDMDLIEVDTGEYTGRTLSELKADPDWQHHIAEPWSTGFGKFGEPSEQVHARAMRAVERYESAIFVTHANPIRHIILALLDMPKEHLYHLSVGNASATCFEIYENFSKLIYANLGCERGINAMI